MKSTSLTWREYKDQIQKLASLDYNYDETLYHSAQDKKGWIIDRYYLILAKENPGPPIEKGAFRVAQNTIRQYEFADPRLIRAVFDPQADLAGRNMLMLAQFAGFHFTFGVRVTKVIDEVRKNDHGDAVQVWGYAYRTLKGHFEIGEIRFEVGKNLNSGEVSFEINAYSKPDRIPNLFYRIGFKIFGRSLQKYFAKSSMERLQKVASEARLH